MKRSSKSRIIIGALVSYGDGADDVTHLKRCLVSFLGGAWGNYALPRKMMTTLLVEGKPREGIEEAHFRISWHNLDIAEAMIASIEEKPKGKRSQKRQVPDEPNVMLTVGSKEFCQAWTHFWATSSDMAHPWGLHLLRRLTNMEADEIAWYDSQDDSLNHNNIGDMYKATQDAILKSSAA